MFLTATVRPMTGSTALYTTPMAPRPTSSIISYRPAFATKVIVVLQPSGPRNARNGLRLHPDPHFAQYPAYFQQVNATGVLVWRTGYAGLPAAGGTSACRPARVLQACKRCRTAP